MEEQKKHIDDWFREGLEGYKETPDAAVWNALEQRLPKSNSRKRFLWLWILLMLALLSSMGYYALKHFSKNEKTTTSETSFEHNAAPEDVREEDKNYEKNSIKENVVTNEKTTTEKNNDLKTKTAIKTSNEGSDKKNDAIVQKQRATNAAAMPVESVENLKEKASSETKTATNTPSSFGKLSDKKINSNPQNTSVKTSSSQAESTTSQKETAAEKNSLKETSTAVSKTANPNVPVVEKNSSNKQTTSAEKNEKPSLKETTNKKPGNAAQPKENAEKTPMALQEKEVVKKNIVPNSSTVKTSSKAVVLQEKSPKSATTNSFSANAAAKETAKPEEKNIKPVSVNTETAKPKPIAVKEESTTPKPLDVKGKKAQEKPIEVNPEANKKATPIEVKPEKAKANPLNIVPEKEYGIKVADYTTTNEEDGGEENTEQAKSSGGGGATSSTFKKDKNGLKLDGGIKIGYEKGIAKVSTQGFTGNIFLQWNISPKVAVVLQPGIRYQLLNATNLFAGQSFHEITGATFDSSHVLTTDTNGAVSMIQRNYIYRNTYDSIVTSFNLTPQKYLEIELPLLLQYSLADNFSLLFGGQLAFGKVIQIESGIKRFAGLNKVDTFSYAPVTPDTSNYPGNIPSLTDHFTYSTPAFSNFNENKYKNPVTNPARFGIMLGFSYEIRKRLLIDLMVRKNVSNLSFIPNEEVRKIYNQPNVRITIGYKLFRSKK